MQEQAFHRGLRARQGHPPDQLGQQPADRVDLVVVQLDVEQLAQVLHRQPRGDPERAAGQRFHRRGGVRVVLVGDLADDLLQDVLDRDDAGGSAVLVHDHREMAPVALHLAQQIVDVLGLGDEDGDPHQLGQPRAGVLRVQGERPGPPCP